MTTALATTQQKVATIRDLIGKNEAQIKAALPRHLPVERMVRTFFTSLSTTPKLLDCTPRSLLGALIQCAQLGLEPGALGHAYLVPFRNNKTGTTEVQFIPGYKGLVDLARRSGEVSTVQAHAVHAKDAFKYAYGLEPRLEHTPSDQQDRGDITHFYAVIRLKDGGVQFEVMSRAEVDAHRDKYSRAAQQGPWVTDYDAMGRKTVLRRVCKLAPVSIEMQRAVALDELAESQVPQELGSLVDLPPEDEPKASATLDALTDTLKITGTVSEVGISEAEPQTPAPAAAASTITPKQAKDFWRESAKHGWSTDQAKAMLASFGITDIHAIPAAYYSELLAMLARGPKAPA